MTTVLIHNINLKIECSVICDKSPLLLDPMCRVVGISAIMYHLTRSSVIVGAKFDAIFVVGRGSTVVKVLCYKSEGRGFDSPWCHFSLS